MKLLTIFATAILFFGTNASTTRKLVAQHGYPFEEHQVQTSDGYLLGLHRIPYSARVPSSAGPRPVAFLMHGLLCSSSDWVLAGPDLGLAYILSDAGYDVWLGNARGNTYSRNHVKYSPALFSFWTFSWHEIGLYDVSAMIDYARYKTGAEKVHYVAHSQGTTAFLVLNSLNPKFSAKIQSAHLLAPVAFMNDLKSPIVKLTAPFLGHPNGLLEYASTEFLPNSIMMEILGYSVCMDVSPVKAVCSNCLFLIAGYDTENMNSTLIPKIMATTPAGSSLNQNIHYLQEHNSRKFRQFDFAMLSNLKKYGSSKPPVYPLTNIKAPIHLYYSTNDYMSAETDVQRLIKSLPTESLIAAYKVPHPKWNHLDYLWAVNVREYLYDELLRNINISS